MRWLFCCPLYAKRLLFGCLSILLLFCTLASIPLVHHKLYPFHKIPDALLKRTIIKIHCCGNQCIPATCNLQPFLMATFRLQNMVVLLFDKILFNLIYSLLVAKTSNTIIFSQLNWQPESKFGCCCDSVKHTDEMAKISNDYAGLYPYFILYPCQIHQLTDVHIFRGTRVLRPVYTGFSYALNLSK